MIIKSQEEDRFDLTLDSDRKRHLVARNGDNLLVPFQYDLYHFQNLVKRNPIKSDEDLWLIIGLRRSNLDVFWARKEGTVSVTRRYWWKLCRVGKEMGLTSILPNMGPFPLEDTQGISLAVSILRWLLDKGRYRVTVQFETDRKMRAAYSNIWHTSKHTLTTSKMVRDLKKTFVNSCPSYILWFERIVRGIHKRMGDEVYQDQAITLEVVHRLVEGLEKYYRSNVENKKREHISNQAVFIFNKYSS